MDNDLEQQSPTPAADAAPDAAPADVAPDSAPAASDSELAAPDPVVDEHVIVHRSFGRADANAPMVVTTITTRDSLRASITGE